VSSMPTRRIRSAGLLAVGAALLAVAASTPARADPVTDWNMHATNALIATARQSPTVSTIHLAIVQAVGSQFRPRPATRERGARCCGR
jgi:hypothetical protein